MPLLHSSCPPAILVCFLAGVSSTQAQQLESPKTPGYSVEITPLPPTVTAGITEHPLEVDINLAEQLVKLGSGPQRLGPRGFQATQFLTRRLTPHYASQLVKPVPECGRFKGGQVAK